MRLSGAIFFLGLLIVAKNSVAQPALEVKPIAGVKENAGEVATKSKPKVPEEEPVEKPPAQAPFSSEEDIEYTEKDSKNLFGLLQSESFIGTVVRPFAKGDLRQLDVYDFGAAHQKITEAKCLAAATQVYGRLKDNSLTKQKLVLHKAPRGPICEVVFNGHSAGDPVREYHLFVFLLKRHYYGFEFRFAKPSTPADIEDIQKFFAGLK